jgi:hypothetical protein
MEAPAIAYLATVIYPLDFKKNGHILDDVRNKSFISTTHSLTQALGYACHHGRH